MDEEEDYIILDVREQDKYDEKHIPGAVLMPYTKAEELGKRLGEIPADIFEYIKENRAGDKSAALKRELQIKALTRKEKEELIAGIEL